MPLKRQFLKRSQRKRHRSTITTGASMVMDIPTAHTAEIAVGNLTFRGTDVRIVGRTYGISPILVGITSVDCAISANKERGSLSEQLRLQR